MRIHPVFHISLLEPAPQNAKPDNTIEIEDEDPEYEVEEILDSRIINNNIEYLVKWKGYPPEENTWEPLKHLENCQKVREEFHQRNPGRPEDDQTPLAAIPTERTHSAQTAKDRKKHQMRSARQR